MSEHTTRYNLRNLSKEPCASPGDFHTDTGLHSLRDPDPEPEGKSTFQLLVDDAVISGILDHAYSDTTNEIIGHLGGTYDKQRNVARCTHICPIQRYVKELKKDSVEGDDIDQVEAKNMFEQQEVAVLGWYHSHPRIKPFPSAKDLQMQQDFQKQVEHSVGIICSTWFSSNRQAPRNKSKHSCYVNIFRVAEGPPLEAVKVAWNVGSEPCLRPGAHTAMERVIQVALKEAEQTRQWFIEDCRDRRSAQVFVNAEYEAFLIRVLREDVTQHGQAIRQDISTIAAHNLSLRSELRELEAKCKDLGVDTEQDVGPMSPISAPAARSSSVGTMASLSG